MSQRARMCRCGHDEDWHYVDTEGIETGLRADGRPRTRQRRLYGTGPCSYPASHRPCLCLAFDPVPV